MTRHSASISERYPIDEATMGHCAQWCLDNARSGEDSFELFATIWDYVNEHFRDGLRAEDSWTKLRDLALRGPL